jgi:lipoyl(octanoyl) transferase
MPSTECRSITSPAHASGGVPAHAYWLGRLGYMEAARLQHRLVEERRRDAVCDTFLFLEHPPVITLGRASEQGNLLAPMSVLAARGIELWETTRGGDVTYHGPGQLVGYGIVDLKAQGRDVGRYLRALEDAVIAFLARHGLVGERHAEYTGVWVGGDKVCAIGVRADHWVTAHGFALNVDSDLSHFDLIVPCGIRGRGVTSLARLAPDTAWRIEDVAREVGEELAARFAWRLEWPEHPGHLAPESSTTDRILGGVRRVFPEPGESS